MGNYVGYFYPVNLSLNPTLSNKQKQSFADHYYKTFTQSIVRSNHNPYVNKKNNETISFISTSTEDSLLSKPDDIDINLITKPLYCNDDVIVNSFPQNIFYYDWDDTLFFTTALKFRFFEYCGHIFTEETEDRNLLLMHFKTEISHLDHLAHSIISKSLLVGNVYIVTNSAVNWVLDMAREYYPQTNTYISSGKVKVVSARDKYSKLAPHDKCMWKKKAFLEIANLYNNRKETNIIVLGDNQLDIDAGAVVSTYFTNCFVKTVKFRERPSFDDLLFQLKECLLRFNEICKCKHNENYFL